MANLEYVVRPYQSPSPFGTTLIPSTPTRADRATLTWGGTSQGTTPTVTTKATAPGMTYQYQCCGDNLTEQTRQSHRIRITGSDGVSYVDVERPYQMKLKNKKQQDCDPSAQISLVTQGINSVLNSFTDAINDSTSQFGNTSDCDAAWNLSG